MLLSKLNLISAAARHLKALHFLNVMGRLELHPSQSSVSDIFVPSPLAEHVMNHCVQAFMIPVGPLWVPVWYALQILNTLSCL